MSNTLDPEKNNTNGHDHMDNNLHGDMNSDQALNRIRTAGSVSISPELFEKLYLSPQNAVKGDLRKTFANPTPLSLIGFLMSLTPLTAALMGWQGAGGLGAATIGTYFWFGGLLMVTGAIFEFILGNTFPFVVFGSFGAFWFTFGSTLAPAFNAETAFTTSPHTSADIVQFYSSFSFFLIWMGVLCVIYLICSLRTNVVFFVIFLTLVPAFGLLAGAFLNLSKGNDAVAQNCQTAGGALLFVTCVAGWWIFFAQMLASVDFPIQVPVGDISHLIKGASARQKTE